MRKVILLTIGLALAGYVYVSCTQPATPPEKLIAQKLLTQVDSFALMCKSLAAQPTHENFEKTRLAYKRIEWAAEYFDPTAALAVNGPPVREVEKSGLAHDPTGLQLIETYFFPVTDTNKKKDLVHQVDILLAATERYQSHFIN